MSLHLMGCRRLDAVGDLGFGSILAPLGDIAKAGIAMKEKSDTENKAAADQKAALDAAVAADAAAASAMAKTDFSAKGKLDSASLDKDAADQAIKTQDRAAGKLSSDSQEKRAAVADKALSAALVKAQANPKDGFAQAYYKAWQTISNKAHAGKMSADDDEDSGDKKGKGKALAKRDSGGGSFLTKKVIGPIPIWGVAAGGVGVAGALALILKKALHK